MRGPLISAAPKSPAVSPQGFTPPARFYRPELDVLRFVAFCMVFALHATPDFSDLVRLGLPSAAARTLSWLALTGAFGVDLFFALSAYLITELLLREKKEFGSVDIRAFYARRILRIWPLYFAFMALGWMLQYLTPNQEIGWRAGLAFTLLAGNWWVVFHGLPNSVIFPLWSVSIEEQFYLVWPPMVRRLSRRAIAFATCGMLAVASFTRLYLGLHSAGETQVWCNTLSRLDPIAAGILIAVFLKGNTPGFRLLTRILAGCVGIAALLLAANYFQIKTDPLLLANMLVGYPLMAAGCTILLLATLGLRGARAPRILIYLGRISYGLYVFHIFGLLVAQHIFMHPTGPVTYLLRVLLAFAITVIMAAGSYRFLESPFLRAKQGFARIPSRPGV